MKNHFMNNKIKVKITGKNISRFLMRLNKNKINIYSSKKSYNTLIIVIDYYNYDKLCDIKTTYDIEILDYLGPIKFKKNILKNKILILIILFCFSLVFFLSCLTFKIEIITNDKTMKNILIRELKISGIHKYSFVKNYKEIEKIKGNILKKYNNIIEWLEISRTGTKYIVRFEPRIIKEKNTENNIYDIVSSKDARIINIDIESGQIIKNVNEYVSKGDLIVSSDIKLYEEVKNIISAKGNIYGEVWYKVKVKYPYNYYEEIKTGKIENTYSISFINSKLMFKKTKFNDTINLSTSIIKNKLLPISLNKEKIYEVIIKKGSKNTNDALNVAIASIEKTLKEKEYIINYKILKESKTDNEIELEIFFSVCQNIGEYRIK